MYRLSVNGYSGNANDSLAYTTTEEDFQPKAATMIIGLTLVLFTDTVLGGIRIVIALI